MQKGRPRKRPPFFIAKLKCFTGDSERKSTASLTPIFVMLAKVNYWGVCD